MNIMNKDKIEVGDYVGHGDGSRLEGTVRYIGILDNAGNENSVWSEWNFAFNGKIATTSYGGNLLYNRMDNTVLIRKGNHFIGKSKGGI